MNTPKLTGPQIGQFSSALLTNFDIFAFQNLVLFEMNIPLGNIASLLKPFEYVVPDTIQYFNYRDQARDLLIAAIKLRPNSSELYKFAQSINQGIQLPDSIKLNNELFTFERLVTEKVGFADINQIISKLAARSHQICHIAIAQSTGGFMSGTGFLVAPDIIMTNYHVVSGIHTSNSNPELAHARFDFSLMDNGVKANPGTVISFAEDWLIDFSPPAWKLDEQVEPDQEPGIDTLDYAFVRLSEKIGDKPIASNENDTKHISLPKRGFINLAETSNNFDFGSIIWVIQHPKGQPMKVAIDTLTSVNQGRTRLRYRTNTEAGSSGSPCFDVNFNPIALHHAGDVRDQPHYNQGIPLSTIVYSLKKEIRQLVIR